jgi:hypothetical protein
VTSGVISNDSVDADEAKTTLIDLDAPATTVKDLSLFPPFGWATKKIRSQGSGLSMSLSLDRLSYNANDSVQGTLRIQVPAKSKLKLGAIEVRVIGFEGTYLFNLSVYYNLSLTSNCKEIKNGKRSPVQRLFHSRRISLQTPRSLPSDAVLSGTPDEDGMWFARPGDAVFPFQLPFTGIQDGVESIKDSCGPLPSSFWKQSFGGVRYVLACTLHYKKGSKHEAPLGIYENLTVLEQLSQIMTPIWAHPSPRSSTSNALEISRGIFSKIKGTLNATLSACTPECENYGDSGIWTSGSTGFVKVEINNGTHKAIKSLTLSLVCRLKTFEESGDADASFKPLNFKRHAVLVEKFNLVPQRNSTGSDILRDPNLAQKQSKSSLLVIAPGEIRNLMLELRVPADIKSVRFGSLVDISYVAELLIHVQGGCAVFFIPFCITHSLG